MPFFRGETACALLELPALTGEIKAQAVKKAIQQCLFRERAKCFQEFWERLPLIANRDPRTDKQIICYSQNSVPAYLYQ